MEFYFAPMEGVTGYIYRTTHHRFFPGIDKYFIPFLSPNQNHCFTNRELQDILPAHNEGLTVVPQLLTKVSDDFLWAAHALEAMGYREVNLNLGCPSGTVVAKGKGSGALAKPEALDRFLNEIFTGTELNISIKTRLGLCEPEEFGRILEIYHQYPVTELTIHPRVQKDFYRVPVRMEAFVQALKSSRIPVCYNGDLVTERDCSDFRRQYPAVNAVMIGRGLLSDPALLDRIQGGHGADRAVLRAFHDTLYQAYCAAFGNRRNAMMRMKELWFYLIHRFADHEKYYKKLRKATDPKEYELLVQGIFQDLPLQEEPDFRPCLYKSM